MDNKAKDKQIIFRLEERYIKELEKKAHEYGMKPNLFARMLVIENLGKPIDSALLKRLDALEAQVDINLDKIVDLVKEAFSVVGNIDREELDKIIPPRQAN